MTPKTKIWAVKDHNGHVVCVKARTKREAIVREAVCYKWKCENDISLVRFWSATDMGESIKQPPEPTEWERKA